MFACACSVLLFAPDLRGRHRAGCDARGGAHEEVTQSRRCQQHSATAAAGARLHLSARRSQAAAFGRSPPSRGTQCWLLAGAWQHIGSRSASAAERMVQFRPGAGGGGERRDDPRSDVIGPAGFEQPEEIQGPASVPGMRPSTACPPTKYIVLLALHPVLSQNQSPARYNPLRRLHPAAEC